MPALMTRPKSDVRFCGAEAAYGHAGLASMRPMLIRLVSICLKSIESVSRVLVHE
jgi:hypothetical protein